MPPGATGTGGGAVWYEDGERRQCQAASEDKMSASLEKIAVRLTADAPNMLRTGGELIAHYLSGDRLPAERQWSRKHAETQRYLCERFVRPALGSLVCQDIRAADMQAVVNAAPTAKEGRRVRAMLSALTGAGIAGGYLANPRLKEVHWQAKAGQQRRCARCRPGSRCCSWTLVRSRRRRMSPGSGTPWPRSGVACMS